ncbi:MAG: hypothetical protein V1749_07560 [Candidatus Desantisbacteria bacterium]
MLDACAIIAYFNNEEGANKVTSDHHELDVLEKKGLIEFEWIR